MTRFIHLGPFSREVFVRVLTEISYHVLLINSDFDSQDKPKSPNLRVFGNQKIKESAPSAKSTPHKSTPVEEKEDNRALFEKSLDMLHHAVS